ncbi:molybdopterin-dependent oxidoreductase [Aliiglaciecola sp. 2_MG-2023]|uniref:nitrate reductase n=1 Tax=unclassified Aliiglaciecola TaxID=2593648 RepID=UPI0026E23AF5|nr:MULTISPECIES: nitrate reductase [unclassified Aliiglaciecola]MDO6712443.1 molybdopterin-dependent oxidoreductase [Aliiglaciecola sp. 2_MG-2023]MDO6753499.1 molybdopterin-dependent oxidoreductase [Aliiglaciecola sp. 1_MG-2023]
MSAHIPRSSIVATENDRAFDCQPSPTLAKTTCPYCGVGCGVDVQVEKPADGGEYRLNQVNGSSDHPANFGRLCVKGSKLLETNGLEGRLLSPKIQGQDVDWQQATQHVANKFRQIIAEHGPGAVAFYVSGQLLTEDYYVANKLMKGYIGTANIDTNSRLCMSSAVSAYKRAFGADAVPCNYEDLELADLIVFIGSNAAWTHPVLFQRIERAKKLNPAMKIVTIDPRQTGTGEIADLHLAIKSGTDTALFNGLLHYLKQHNKLDQNYIDANTEGFDAALDCAKQWTLEKVAQVCDIPLIDVAKFYTLFADSDKAVSAYTMGVNQSSSGTDKANSIINCHLASGKLGREGCGPFSLTGQPNAMGGREVGGLANMLAAHMDIDNPQHQQIVQSYWQSPAIPKTIGLKAVDMFDEVHKGNIKAIWIMATNPMVSMPNRGKIASALQKCEFVVVSDCVAKNDTLAMADVVLPATGWSEKNGTVTNSERRISRQRGILSAPGLAKHDWQIICDVAKAMGFEQGFNYLNPSEIFREHAGLTAYKNHGLRALDLSALQHISEKEYDRLKPVQWPINANNRSGTQRLFTDGQFYTASKKAQFIALQPKAPEVATSADFPFVLNSGRIRDQWHTMTRTGKTAELTGHIDRAFVHMHPLDAKQNGICDGDFLEITSAISQKHAQTEQHKKVIMPVKLQPQQRTGELFAPIHWSGTNSSSSAIAALYSDASDAVSGQPELKHSAVNVKLCNYPLHGQLFTRKKLDHRLLNQVAEYWSEIAIDQGYLVYFASDNAEMVSELQVNLPLCTEWFSSRQKTELGDKRNIFALRDGGLDLALFWDSNAPQMDVNWINSLLQQTALLDEQKSALLRATPDPAFAQGRLICSCFKVGENTIVEAIKQGCNSVDKLGDELKCGTNCGSCKTELKQLVKSHTYEGNITILDAELKPLQTGT